MEDNLTENTQYHFVVYYDCNTGRFETDYDTRDALFWDGVAFNTATDEWRPLEPEEWAEEGTVYDKASDKLFEILQKENEVNAR
jgi:hypothetical protein